MSLETEFLELMGEAITLKAPSSVDKYGKRAFGTAQSFTARVQPKVHMTRDSAGREVVGRGIVYVYGSPSVTPEWELTLADGSKPVIIAVYRARDEDGAHHTEIAYGDARSV
jgi:hypothetical protein